MNLYFHWHPSTVLVCIPWFHTPLSVCVCVRVFADYLHGFVISIGASTFTHLIRGFVSSARWINSFRIPFLLMPFTGSLSLYLIGLIEIMAQTMIVITIIIMSENSVTVGYPCTMQNAHIPREANAYKNIQWAWLHLFMRFQFIRISPVRALRRKLLNLPDIFCEQQKRKNFSLQLFLRYTCIPLSLRATESFLIFSSGAGWAYIRNLKLIRLGSFYMGISRINYFPTCFPCRCTNWMKNNKYAHINLFSNLNHNMWYSRNQGFLFVCPTFYCSFSTGMKLN